MTKGIANHLNPILPHPILPEQTSYVEGRKILDGIGVAHEVIHLLKRSRNTSMLINLDLSKTFDMIIWSYML